MFYNHSILIDLFTVCSFESSHFYSHATLNVLTWHFPPSIQSLSDDKHWKQKGNWIDDRREKIWPCCGTGTILTHTSQVSPYLAAPYLEILQSIAAEIQSRSSWTCTPWFMLCGQSGQVNFMEMAVEFLTGMDHLYIFKNGTKKNKKYNGTSKTRILNIQFKTLKPQWNSRIRNPI